MTDFDPNNASTWDDHQRAVYETGHREGESCRDADWYFALLDLMPQEIAAAGVDHGALVAWVQHSLRQQVASR